jgi:3-oxoacyl-[acyl-carrier-protein] synthase-3
MGIKILGLGTFSPPHSVTNEDFAGIMDTSDEWITERTGIKNRQYALSDKGYISTWRMAEEAARAALLNAGMSPSDIDLIITSTITADFFTPSVSCLVQGAIGASCPAFDIGAACAGFTYALDTAEKFLRADPDIKNVMVISSEMLTRSVDFDERSTAILFGDGAAAAIITRSEALYGSYLGADGTGAKHLFGKFPLPENPFTTEVSDMGMADFPGKDAVIIQTGREVYRFATRIMPLAAEEAIKRAGLTPADVNWFIPHQANIRIIQTAAKSMEIPLERFIINIEKHGNTSSASIPIALCEAVVCGKVKRGDIVCTVGFGAGLTYGAAVFEY